MKQLWSLQYLRALAAVSVLLYHTLESSNHKFQLGNIGVDVFFILSGFLMFSVTFRRNRTSLQFMSDRIARIAPIYWVATFAAFACAALDPSFLGPFAYTDPGLLIHSLLFIPYPNPAGWLWPTVIVGWSLNYEMFFYVTFAFALALSDRVRLGVLSMVFLGLIAAGQIAHGQSPLWLTYTSPLLLEFLAGVWIGWQYAQPGGQPLRAAIGLGAIVVALLMVGWILPRVEHAWMAALLVITGVLWERSGTMPRLPALKGIGDASYSIYLFQQFAFCAVDRVIALQADVTHIRLDTGPIRIPLEFAAAILLGLAVYHGLERPLSSYARTALARILPRPARLVPVLPDHT